jgi:hypothetical protein
VLILSKLSNLFQSRNGLNSASDDNLEAFKSKSLIYFSFHSTEEKVPKPLLKDAFCDTKTELGCGDGTCLPNEYFCDGLYFSVTITVGKNLNFLTGINGALNFRINGT